MPEKVRFDRRMLIVGFGAVGQGSLPLILRHLAISPDQLSIVSADEGGRDIASSYQVAFEALPLDRGNFASILAGRLASGDFLVNAALDVSSVDLIDWCQAKGVHYIDACLEPWAGGHTDLATTAALRSNYAYREQALALRKKYPRGPSCVLMHGANPGLVSHFVKQALENLCRDHGVPVPAAPARGDWGRLAETLGVRAIQIAERDGQISGVPKRPDEFVNTWSCAAFYGEAQQPAEMGWGSHEKTMPRDGREYGFGCGAGIYLDRPGLATQVRSWTPMHGPYHGWLISHGESISIADYLTVKKDGQVSYRPTCYYAYQPCDGAVLSLLEFHGRGGRPQAREHVMRDELVGGVDELGVLLMGPARGAYWYGSQLDVHEARRLCPHNNATTLQINAPFVAAIIWAIQHPAAGIVEPDEIDHRAMLDFSRPYLGTMTGAYTDWTPLQECSTLFPEDTDNTDPWQFKNFRVD